MTDEETQLKGKRSIHSLDKALAESPYLSDVDKTERYKYARQTAWDLSLHFDDFEVSHTNLKGAPSTYPLKHISALMEETRQLLRGIAVGQITRSQPRIATNLLAVVGLLEQMGPQNESHIERVIEVLGIATDHNLTVDGYTLTPERYVERVGRGS